MWLSTQKVYCPNCKEEVEYDTFGCVILTHCRKCGYEFIIQLIGVAISIGVAINKENLEKGEGATKTKT